MEILDRLFIYIYFFKIACHEASNERMIKSDELGRRKKKGRSLDGRGRLSKSADIRASCILINTR
jgi:hypothetical protein